MKRILATTAITAALFTSCYKAELHDTSHPYHGEIIFEITTPTQPDGTDYEDPLIFIFDDQEYTVNPGDELNSDLLEPGTYTYYIYSDYKEGDTSTITYDPEAGTIIASVEMDSDGNVDPNPNIVYFGTQTIEVTEDSIIAVETQSSAIGCQLNFYIELEGDAADRISGAELTLDGIAQQWDCINDTSYGASASVVTELSIGSYVENGQTIYYLEGSVYLLGIVESDSQTLTLVLDYEDSNPSTQTYTSDVSGVLSELNHSSSITITNTVETPTESDFGGTIEDWTLKSYSVEAK